MGTTELAEVCLSETGLCVCVCVSECVSVCVRACVRVRVCECEIASHLQL